MRLLLYEQQKTAFGKDEVNVGCSNTINVLNTCAHESECDADMLMYLPSEPRSHFIALSKQNWFNMDEFKLYCVAACNSKNITIDVDVFKSQVCAFVAQ